MATETTEGQSEDDGEDARLKEENDHEKGKTTPVGGSSAASVDTDGGSEEDHDGGLVDEQDNAGLETEVHEASSAEATDGEESLGDSVVVGTLVVSLGDAHLGVRLGEEVDEERGDTDLSTNVAELSGNTEEEGVLFAEGLVGVSSSSGHHLGLISHVGVGDLRDGSEVEYNSQDTDEDGDTKVNPLDRLKRLAVRTDILEDDEGSKDGSNDGANSLERLRKLETELSPLRRTADSNVGIGRGLESRQTGANNEHGTAETTEASLDSGWPEHKSSDAVDSETEHEGVAVAELAQEPSRVCEGTDEVGTEVGGLETRRLSLSDVQGNLEARVENIEKTVGEAPEEEEECNHGDRDDGLLGGQLGSSSDDAVVNALAANILIDGLDSGRAASLLLVDLLEGRLLRAVETKNHSEGWLNGSKIE